ncbi:hypothetical protein OIU83_06585 [Flavobacterium sp. LS1R49]|uniref:Lysine transporter LysE n=1 Tax=Flavobacterium shii TaxID=2987687 RepID=A0A9X2ZAL4_9FLAO|nr:hypothetical protein [Flavobacterium shii]MCV9927309.1 hypothetical protein [Flavobacterium shii]
MKQVKNISVGFLVSFLGSIPLGYLNLVGFEIYNRSGFDNLFLFLLGIVFVESFVIYFTLLFARQLVDNKKLMKGIDFFTVIFMLAFAYLFYIHFDSNINEHSYLEKYIMYSPFVIGVLLNCFNFLQLPFWTDWNLYLIDENYISTEKDFKYYYIAGTLIGFFLGMLSLILILQFIFNNTSLFFNYLMSVLIPLFFIVLAGIQIFKVYNKYFRSKTTKTLPNQTSSI